MGFLLQNPSRTPTDSCISDIRLKSYENVSLSFHKPPPWWYTTNGAPVQNLSWAVIFQSLYIVFLIKTLKLFCWSFLASFLCLLGNYQKDLNCRVALLSPWEKEQTPFSFACSSGPISRRTIGDSSVPSSFAATNTPRGISFLMEAAILRVSKWKVWSLASCTVRLTPKEARALGNDPRGSVGDLLLFG